MKRWPGSVGAPKMDFIHAASGGNGGVPAAEGAVLPMSTIG
jgi:hypothetical protein